MNPHWPLDLSSAIVWRPLASNETAIGGPPKVGGGGGGIAEVLFTPIGLGQ